MGFYHFEGGGLIHLNEAKPPRVVPGPERHKWDGKPDWGQSTKCVKCGCLKQRKKTQPYYSETYTMPGKEETTERPACTGKVIKPQAV